MNIKDNNSESVINALSVDVEDYFQVSAFENAIDREQWEQLPLRVEQNTQRLLELFEQKSVKATFFILGWVADKVPNLITDIADAGHEIACHGYSHKLIYNQSKKEFADETIRAKSLLEDISGKKVNGYRAASYSITRKSLWALDILAEAGFEYDSSIFPVVHDRYGLPGSPEGIYYFETESGQKLIEYPLTTVKVGPLTLPMAGGGYFRLYPYWFTHLNLAQINKKTRKPFIFYLHPWEIDAKQPKIQAGMLSRFRHYNNLDKCEGRLEKLLNFFKFTSIQDVLDKQKDIPKYTFN